MKKSLILKSQADQVFLIINQFSLNPKDFVWEEAKSGLTVDLFISKLFHSKTNYFFKFDLNKGNHCCTYSPGETKQADTQYPGSWELQLNYFRNWLKYLKREIDSPIYGVKLIKKIYLQKELLSMKIICLFLLLNLRKYIQV